MNRKMTTAAIGVLLLTSSAPAAAQFEGVIAQRTISVSLDALAERGIEGEQVMSLPLERILALQAELTASGDMTVTETQIFVKGRKFRSDATDDDGPAYAVVDLDAGVMRLVRPGQRMYIEMTREDLARMATMMGGGAAPVPAVTAVGDRRTINGMTTSAFEVAEDVGTTRVWVSNDHQALASSFRQFAELLQSMTMGDNTDPSFAVAEHGFPVLTQRVTYDTYEIEETVSVHEQAVDDARFAPPTGFRKMTMADLMRGGPSAAVPATVHTTVSAGRITSGSDQWIEYTVTGPSTITGREEGMTMCANTDSGLEARNLGDWYFTFEADGTGPGEHAARYEVTAPQELEAFHDPGPHGNYRFNGQGTITVSAAGQGQLGLDLIEITFSASGLQAGGGLEIAVEGRMRCAVM